MTAGCLGLFPLDGYGPPSASVDAGDTTDAGLADGSGNVIDPNARIVFVTSSLFTGNLGAVEGANALCNAFAADAGLRGTYKAWLSHNDESPSRSFADLVSPDAAADAAELVTPSGELIATSYAALAERGPLQPLVETERRTRLDVGSDCSSSPTTGRVWTNTKPNGTPTGVDNGQKYSCRGWRADESASYGFVGVLGSGASAVQWTLGCSEAEPHACPSSAHLYCFEQRP